MVDNLAYSKICWTYYLFVPNIGGSWLKMGLFQQIHLHCPFITKLLNFEEAR